MITHVVTFRWKPETTADQIAAVTEGLATMPGLVPTIAGYSFGADLGLGGNMDYAVVATFESLDDWRVYDSHPDHERLRAELIRPYLADRAAVQFES